MFYNNQIMNSLNEWLENAFFKIKLSCLVKINAKSQKYHIVCGA
jgi:hypothetical protein